MAVSPWEKLLQKPQPRGHFVQMYRADELALAKNVGLYIWEGLRRNDGVLIIATPEHRELFCQYVHQLGANTSTCIERQQLLLLDAQETLAQFMIGGQPDWFRFETVLRAAMRKVLPAKQESGLRAYGEMVGVLWNAKQFDPAIRLEQLWNRLLEQSSFSLYCAYAIDLFGREFHVANLDSVLCAHTHLVPAQSNGNLEAALHRAMAEILGDKAEALKVLIKANYRPSWAVMPNPESIVLWLRNNLPGVSEEILGRAREHYLVLEGAQG